MESMKAEDNKLDNKLDKSTEDKKHNKIAEKALYIFILSMVVIIIAAITLLIKPDIDMSKLRTSLSIPKTNSTNTDSDGKTYVNNEIYILTNGELTDTEIKNIEKKYKCAIHLTDNSTHNISYKIVFKSKQSDSNITAIKNELKKMDKVIIATVNLVQQ